MGDVATLIKKVEELDGRHKAISRQLDEARQKLAEKMCPLAVGDVVTICGYAHEGKKGEVRSIRYKAHFLDGHGWQVTVTVLKSNGDPSKQTARFDNRQWDEANA